MDNRLITNSLYSKRFNHFGAKVKKNSVLSVKIWKGPREVGKTSLLDHLGAHQLVLFNDIGMRQLANSNPEVFFAQFRGPLILDEVTLGSEIFMEIKKRVGEQFCGLLVLIKPCFTDQ